MKTITVEDDTWIALTEIKVKKGKETLDDVIRELLKNEKVDWYQHFHDEVSKV